VKSRFQGVLRNEKRDSSEKGKRRQNKKMEEDNQQSELEERGEELRRIEITKKLEATIQQLRTRAIFGRLFLTRMVLLPD
jgi:hypothetical protein